jgi:hypothetical protein
MVLLAGCLMTAKAQQIPSPISPPPISRPPGSPGQSPNPSDENDGDSMAHRAMKQQALRRNEQRQQEIVNDTAKLLALTQQLKAEMEKSSKDPNSVSAIKKAEEIEKLAKAVKEKMKGS